MRHLLSILLIVLVSCNTPEINVQNNENQAVDSILIQSEKSFITADSIGKQSDSIISTKVTKTANQISTLKEEVKILKQENNVLKIKLDDAADGSKPFQLLPVSSGKNDR